MEATSSRLAKPKRSRRACLTVFASVFGLLAAWFVIMTGWYAIQIKRGRATELEREFTSAQFTRDLSRTVANRTPPADIRPFIRKENPVRGAINAPITILAFIDFECPFSQKGYAVFERVAERYAPAVRIVFKHFPISSVHPQAAPAANAAVCAGAQGKFWPYYHELFARRTLSDADLLSRAASVGADPAAFAECFRGDAQGPDVDKDLADGVDLGVRGTPTYFVNGVKIEGVADEAIWDRIILQQLQTQKRR